MKRILLVILALCFMVPAYAGTVGDIDGQAWIKHTNEMQGLRKGILSLVTKENRTPQDTKRLEVLTQAFEAKHLAWESYLKDVAENGKDAVPPTTMRAHRDGFKTATYKRSHDQKRMVRPSKVQGKAGMKLKQAKSCNKCCCCKKQAMKKACDKQQTAKKACQHKQTMKKACDKQQTAKKACEHKQAMKRACDKQQACDKGQATKKSCNH
jgi:hypothetical protein